MVPDGEFYLGVLFTSQSETLVLLGQVRPEAAICSAEEGAFPIVFIETLEREKKKKEFKGAVPFNPKDINGYKRFKRYIDHILKVCLFTFAALGLSAWIQEI